MAHNYRICIFSENFELIHPDCGSILVVKSVLNQALKKIHQFAHQTREQKMQKRFGMDD